MHITNNKPIRVQTPEGWIVVLQHTPWSDNYELNIGKVDVNNSKFYHASAEKNGYLKLTEVKEGESTDPILRIPGSAWQGLAEALRGVVPDTDVKEIDAELKATKYHLEDMRKLAKLK